MDVIAYFKARWNTPSATEPATTGPAPAGGSIPAVLTTDALLAVASQKLAQAEVGARVAKAFVEAGAARAANAIKLGQKSGTEGVKLMRPRNLIAAAARNAAENASKLVSAARIARVASVAMAAIELSQVRSDNPDYSAQ